MLGDVGWDGKNSGATCNNTEMYRSRREAYFRFDLWGDPVAFHFACEADVVHVTRGHTRPRKAATRACCSLHLDASFCRDKGAVRRRFFCGAKPKQLVLRVEQWRTFVFLFHGVRFSRELLRFLAARLA